MVAMSDMRKLREADIWYGPLIFEMECLVVKRVLGMVPLWCLEVLLKQTSISKIFFLRWQLKFLIVACYIYWQRRIQQLYQDGTQWDWIWWHVADWRSLWCSEVHEEALSYDELQRVFSKWSKGELVSFLIEITADIFGIKDDKGDEYLVDKVLDETKMKSSGEWTVQQASELSIAASTITSSIDSRFLSGLKEERVQAEKLSNLLGLMKSSHNKH